MTRPTVLSAIAILVIVGAVASIFAFNATPPSDKAPTLVALSLDQRMATDAAKIRDAKAVADIMLRRIQDSEALADLSPIKVANLAERCALTVVVRCQGSADDFITLLEQWGGRLNIPKDGPDYQRMVTSWLSPGHKDAVAKIGLDETDVARIQPTPGVARVMNRTGVSATGMMTSAPVDFAGNRVDLLKSGADQVEVFFPVVSNSGDIRQVGIRMIWSEPDGNWIPLVFIQYVEPGKAMPSSIF